MVHGFDDSDETAENARIETEKWERCKSRSQIATPSTGKAINLRRNLGTYGIEVCSSTSELRERPARPLGLAAASGLQINVAVGPTVGVGPKWALHTAD